MNKQSCFFVIETTPSPQTINIDFVTNNHNRKVSCPTYEQNCDSVVKFIHECFYLNQMCAEITVMEKNIESLKKAIRDKENPMKVSQTRLENRTYRPGVELCRDPVQYKYVHITLSHLVIHFVL